MIGAVVWVFILVHSITVVPGATVNIALSISKGYASKEACEAEKVKYDKTQLILGCTQIPVLKEGIQS